MKAKDFYGRSVVDSREVAAMVEKKHKNLLADIRGYIEIMERSGELKFQPSEFFILSTYVSEQNKELPCYFITKKGCDMIANKLTGEKGVLFTAAYVSAFEEMQQTIAAPRHIPEVSPGGLAKLILATRKVMLEAGSSALDVREATKSIYETWRVPVPPVLTKHLPGQISLFERPALEQ